MIIQILSNKVTNTIMVLISNLKNMKKMKTQLLKNAHHVGENSMRRLTISIPRYAKLYS